MERIISCPYQNDGHYEISTKDFGSTLFESLQKYSTRIAFADVVTGEKVTFGELKTKAEIFARHLLKSGISKGDILAIFSPNSIEWVIVAAAALRAGVILAGINCMLTAGELLHHVKTISPKVLYTTQDLVKTVLECRAKYEQKFKVVVKGTADGCISMDQLFNHPSSSSHLLPPLPSFEELRLKPEDTATIAFSSGTTGLQKAVLNTHRTLHAEFIAMTHPKANLIIEESLNYLPFSHAGGFLWMIYPPLLGFRVLVVPRFDFPLLLSCLEKYKTEKMITVPTVATLFAKSPEVEKFSLKHLRYMWCGAAPLGPETEALILERLPGVSFMQCYGMTEMSGISHADLFDAPEGRKPGSAGFPLLNVQAKVIDVQSGQSLGPNQQGEICMRGSTTTPGYRNNPRATEELIDKGGWLHSGDIGCYDDDGRFFIVDRLKELIKYNAYQVAPAELETLLLSHPQVAEACVFGLPDVKAGELPTACVVLKPGSQATESQLEQFVAGKVAPYKRLRGGVRFVVDIPKASNGKLLRRQLKADQLKARI